MVKIKLLVSLVIFTIFIVSCTPTEVQSEIVAVEEVSQELIDPCKDFDFIQGRIISLVEEITEAETELNGMSIDIEFAKEDNSNVVEVEELIKSQQEYVADLNSQMTELQELIKEC